MKWNFSFSPPIFGQSKVWRVMLSSVFLFLLFPFLFRLLQIIKVNERTNEWTKNKRNPKQREKRFRLSWLASIFFIRKKQTCEKLQCTFLSTKSTRLCCSSLLHFVCVCVCICNICKVFATENSLGTVSLSICEVKFQVNP